MRDTRRNQRGFISVVGALLLLAVMMFGGLAIDIGYMQWQKRQAQIAADAAAVGAVQELRNGGGSYTTAAKNDAALNGYDDAATDVVVTVNRPPVYGNFAGNSNAVEAVVQRTVPTFFMMLAGRNSVTITARAVATTFSGGGSGSGCVVALNKSADGALRISGGNSTYSQCSWVSESSSSQAFLMGGSATLYLTSAYMQNSANVGVVGWYRLNGGAMVWDVQANAPKPPVKISDPGDPLATVTAPTSGGAIQAYNAAYDKNNMPDGNTLQPGIYCNGIVFGDTGNTTITMAPGTYIMAGGGFGGTSSPRIVANGVTVYSTSSSGWGCSNSYDFKPLSFTGQASITWSAPTSGSFKGVAYMQDRNIIDSRDNTFAGGSGTTLDGAIYIKTGSLKFAGNSSVSGYMFLVADTIDIVGNSSIGANYSSLGGNNPFMPVTAGGLSE